MRSSGAFADVSAHSLHIFGKRRSAVFALISSMLRLIEMAVDGVFGTSSECLVSR